MADQKPPQIDPEDESKKDTVRINLPPGLTSRPTGAPAPGGPATVKLKPATGATSEDEAKKETAVMGRPTEAPKPKSDTSRVPVTAARPAVAETPRPTVKLKQADPAPVQQAPAAAPVAAARAPAATAEVSVAVGVLSLAAMVLSVAVAVYLGMLYTG